MCLPNGVVRTFTDNSLLEKRTLMPKMRWLLSLSRNKITKIAQVQISLNSLELLKEEAVRITSLPSQDKEHLLKILSITKCPVIEKFEPKTFGCMFYEYKAILSRLREEKGLVCFKSIVPEGETPFQIILLRPQEAGGEFLLVPDKEYQDLSAELVVVFDSVINRQYTRDAFAKKIEEIGFTKLILEAAAIEDPYQAGSKLEEINDTDAQAEIIRYRKYAEQDGCQTNVLFPRLVMLDHVYCTIVGAELPLSSKETKK